MKVLILEDDPERMKSFASLFSKDVIHHAEHSHEAIELLKNNFYDLICLDHDLGGTQINFDPEDCGTIVAEYLHDHPTEAEIIIHSYNTPAAQTMMSLIPSAQHIPGFWLMK
jgi:CheY-like chemotaxis protein